MEYLKKEYGAYNLHLIKTNKFKTITVRVSFRNPNKKEEVTLRQPQAILEEMKALDEESAEILNSILELI